LLLGIIIYNHSLVVPGIQDQLAMTETYAAVCEVGLLCYNFVCMFVLRDHVRSQNVLKDIAIS